MVTRSRALCQTASWRDELAAAYRTLPPLLAALDLEPERLPGLAPAGARDLGERRFPLLVTRTLVRAMRRGDPRDPILRQVLPLASEQQPAPGFVADPLAERAAGADSGLLRKYRGRALLLLTSACALHCRYCFRRHFRHDALPPLTARLDAAFDQLAAAPGIDELILSGGDPLLLDDAALDQVLARATALGSLRRLRIHTRLPLALPSRITPALCRILAERPWPIAMVIQTNHPRELGDEARAALERLAASGLTLLNQSVLLRGVNDDAGTLAALGETLFDSGVLPYYLHQLDPVQGAAHFQVADARARALLAEVRERLPGYLVPRLVREHPGARAKTPL